MKPQPGFVKRKVRRRPAGLPLPQLAAFCPQALEAGSLLQRRGAPEDTPPQQPDHLVLSGSPRPLSPGEPPLPSIRCLSRKQMEGRGCQTSPSALEVSEALW